MKPLDHADPAFADLLGQAIVALSYRLCGVAFDARPAPGGVIQGFDKLAPIYVATTEGRDGPGPLQRAHYSSCGDQLHRILELVGVREEWLNRKSLGHYRDGQNIIHLEPGPCPLAKAPPNDPTYRPPPGSLCLMWTSGYDAHAFTILGEGSDANHIRTGNYGAGGMSSATAPGADIADSPCVWDPTRKALLIGGSHRALHSVITPAAIVPFISAQIDLSGAEVSGELVEALGARYE